MLVWFIVGGEVGFWVLLAAGLVARYLLRRPRAGAILLAAAPLVDLVLLTASVLDLRGGGEAGLPHVLAAVYLGVSVGFGHSLVRWADVRFAHRFAAGPAPAPTPRAGRAHAVAQRQAWLRHLAAWSVGVGLMAAAVLLVGDPDRTAAFHGPALGWTIAIVVDAVISLSYTVRPRDVARGGPRDVARGAGVIPERY